MNNIKQIIKFYNQVNDKEVSEESISNIIPKLHMILNKRKLDNIEIVILIDFLLETEKNHQLDTITPEIIDLINKILNDDKQKLYGTLSFTDSLRYTIVPYNIDSYKNSDQLIIFLSEFEILIELIRENLKAKEINILDKYNHNLKEIVINYKEVLDIYKKIVYGDVMLSSMISHFATILYLNIEKYDYDYELLKNVFYKLIENYQTFIDYCCSLGLQKNYNKLIIEDLVNVELEYEIANNMLEYVYNEKLNEKKKRKE